MAPSNPLSYWERVGDSFYRKVPVYDAIFDEDVELENYIVAGAPYGGAIGMRPVYMDAVTTILTQLQLCIMMRANCIDFKVLRQPNRVLTFTLVRESISTD